MPKRKYRKMKGGNNPDSNLIEPSNKKNIEPTRNKMGASKSTYSKYNTNILIIIVTSFSIIGVIWFFVSRNLVKHRYSEALSYGLIAFSILLSLILVIIAGIKSVSHKSENGFIDALRKIISVSQYVLVKGFPALLILIQLGILINLFIKHNSYLFLTESLPTTFTMFNVVALIMILYQIYMWRGELMKLLVTTNVKSSRYILPGFIFATLVSGLSIGQIYVLLEHLKTDC